MKGAPAAEPGTGPVATAGPGEQGPRTVVLPDIYWVGIPGGDFVYQKGERGSLPAFFVARYPVTNVQYQTFIDADGYRDERWWTDLVRPEPEESRWSQANRPRTNVNWYEAVAFSRWLSAQFGHEVRLPTEDEWERAARGYDGREYPWGDGYRTGYANIDEKATQAGEWYLEQTTAVGVYPHAASLGGILDLAGNVWEWCLNKWERPEQFEADTSDDARMLCGGCWSRDAAYARGAQRFALPPGYRSLINGFRLVSSGPIA